MVHYVVEMGNDFGSLSIDPAQGVLDIYSVIELEMPSLNKPEIVHLPVLHSERPLETISCNSIDARVLLPSLLSDMMQHPCSRT